MNLINIKSTILPFAMLILFGVGFSACNADEEDVVILKTLEEYRAELSALISSEKIAVQNCVVGYNKGDFKSDEFYADYTSGYLSALLDAEQVLASPDLTIADVIAANKGLTPSGNLFNANIWISDRRPLHELIVYCDTLRVHTPIGTEVGQAPQEAHDQFETAINAAKAVRGRSSTIDRQVAEAVEKLNPELEIFEEAIIK